MKFTLSTITQCSGRLGLIADVERLPNLVLETPALFLHTKGGVVPHLTYETLQMVTKDHLALSLPVAGSYMCYQPCFELKKPIADFIGMKEYFTFCGVHDPAQPLPQGYSSKTHISLWTKSGRENLDADGYMDIIEALQPDMYQALCVSDTDKSSSKKRVVRVVDTTYQFFKTCLERHQNSQVLSKSTLLAVLEGGFSETSRAYAARKLAKEPVAGFVIDGLEANGPNAEQISLEVLSPLVQESVKPLPESSLRLAPGCWSPEAVWQLVKLGVDVFDSSLATSVSTRGSALNFSFCPETTRFTYHSPELTSERGDDASSMKKDEIKFSKYEINLRDTVYRECLEPLVAGCSCVTCTSHSRAYVHHLLITQELLGPILLMIHNLHHSLEFFKCIRKAVKLASSS